MDAARQLLVDVLVDKTLALCHTGIDIGRQHVSTQRAVVFHEVLVLIPVHHFLDKGTAGFCTHHSCLNLDALYKNVSCTVSVSVQILHGATFLYLYGVILHAGEERVVEEVVELLQQHHVGVQIDATLRIEGIHADIVGCKSPFAGFKGLLDVGHGIDIEVMGVPTDDVIVWVSLVPRVHAFPDFLRKGLVAQPAVMYLLWNHLMGY